MHAQQKNLRELFFFLFVGDLVIETPPYQIHPTKNSNLQNPLQNANIENPHPSGRCKWCHQFKGATEVKGAAKE